MKMLDFYYYILFYVVMKQHLMIFEFLMKVTTFITWMFKWSVNNYVMVLIELI